MAFGQLQNEVPGVPDEAPAGFEEPLPETHQGRTLDGGRQGKPTQEIAEVARDDPEQEVDLLFEKPEPGDSVQVDVKFVRIEGRWMFQYTARDDCTRFPSRSAGCS